LRVFERDFSWPLIRRGVLNRRITVVYFSRKRKRKVMYGQRIKKKGTWILNKGHLNLNQLPFEEKERWPNFFFWI